MSIVSNPLNAECVWKKQNNWRVFQKSTPPDIKQNFEAPPSTFPVVRLDRATDPIQWFILTSNLTVLDHSFFFFCLYTGKHDKIVTSENFSEMIACPVPYRNIRQMTKTDTSNSDDYCGCLDHMLIFHLLCLPLKYISASSYCLLKIMIPIIPVVHCCWCLILCVWSKI